MKQGKEWQVSSSEDLALIWRERIADARGYLASTLTATEIEFVISVAMATGVESIIDAMESQQIRMEALPEIFDLSAKVYCDLVRRIRAKQSTIQISVGEVTPERGTRSGIWHFPSKIAGVSHANPDGVSRQSIIARVHIGEWLRLKR